jgi:Na+-driven multidrug efflux pump
MRILLAVVLYSVFDMGSIGIWLGLGIGNVTAAALALGYIWFGNWRERIID